LTKARPIGSGLIRDTLLYLPAQIVGPAAQFAAILVFTHWLEPGPYGIFTYVLASQDLVFLLCLSWWSQYTVRYIGDHVARADDSYHRSEATIIVGTVAMQIAATLLALRLISERIPASLVAAALLYTVTRCLTLHLGERARASAQILDYSLAQSAGPIAGFALAFPAVAYIDATPTVALVGYGIAQGVMLMWLMTRQNISYRPRFPDPELTRQALTFGVPLIAAGLAAWCGMNAIRVLVDHSLGASAMGLIAVGWGLGNRLTSTAAMLVTVAAYPLAVESLRVGTRAQAFAQIMSNGVVMLGVVLPAAMGVFLLQGLLVTLMVAEPFRAMTLAVLPAALAAGLFRNIRTHVFDQVFMLVERTGMVCWLSVLEAALAIAGCIVGLAMDGARGATLGSAAGYGLALVASLAVAHLVEGLRVPWFGIARVLIATGIMTLAVAVAPDDGVPGGPYIAIALKVVAGATAYLVATCMLFPSVYQLALSRWRRPVTSV
jgi:O-antigen/teichoic acid export membrane protein